MGDNAQKQFPEWERDDLGLMSAAELTGPIVRKDARKQIAYAPVLVPGEPDADGETLTAEKVEEVAHLWLEQFRALDRQHGLKAIDAAPVESYLEPKERHVTAPDGRVITLPEGTWTLAAKIRDAGIWADVEAGRVEGFSVMGVPREELERALGAVKSGDRTALKRTILADVGGGDANGDWVAPFVSVVKGPAVPKAKWIALKSTDDPEPDRGGLMQRLAGILGIEGAEKVGRKFSDRTFDQLRAATEALQALLEEAEKERSREAGKAEGGDDVDEDKVKEIVRDNVGEAVKSALNDGLREQFDSYVNELAEFGDQPKSSEGGDGGDGSEGSDDKSDDSDDGDGDDGAESVEALKSEVAELRETVERRTGARSRGLPDDDDDGSAKKSSVAGEYDAFGRRRRQAG